MSKNKKLPKISGSDNAEPTMRDVINTVNTSFTVVATEIQGMKQNIANIQSTMVTKDELTEELARMETRLVTKDYLDEKMNDLRGDLTVSLRKEDQKVVTLVSILEERKVLSKRDAQRVMTMDLFPRKAS